MAKSSGLKNAPSAKPGVPSGGSRANNPPSKPATSSGSSKGTSKGK